MKKSILLLLPIILLAACQKVIETTVEEPVTDNIVRESTALRNRTVNVGDGSSNLTITGNYASGTTIVVKPGTYNKGGGITIKNISNVTIQLTGVILDGLNQTQPGFYNVLELENLKNVTIKGGTTQNCGYRQLYLTNKIDGLVITGHEFKNNAEGIFTSGGTVWDGTDATVPFKNIAFRQCSFINCGSSSIGGSVDNNTVTDLVRKFEISACTISDANPGTAFYFPAIDNALVFNNTLARINLGLTNDNRIFLFTGTAEFYGNKITQYQGHLAAAWAVSFGTVKKTSHFYNNNCNGSLKYSAFEFQEFDRLNIPGKTSISDLVVSGNTCANLNTEHHDEFAANFIDNYEYGLMGGHVSLLNNIGSNFYPIPEPNVFWNLAKPSIATGNTYR
ncbi:MAG: hypothetical protein CFE25_07390 [Chitinophagaceae bacterium BSSC1]|nr:MAG: hypothetical protein CFE25_07390 [Chitinophagaceae bacterium BSSC1]